MADKEQNIKLKTTIQADALDIYQAFTNPITLQEWLCNVAEADPHRGGRLYFWWQSGYYASGEFTTLKPGERLAFTWHGRNEPGQSQVKINLKRVSEGVKVTLVHNLPDNSKIWRKAGRAMRKGWKRGLENLRSIIETGQDLRLINRPVMGLGAYKEIDAESSAALGLSEGYGLLVKSLVEGLTAHKAGIQVGDVLLKLGKTELRNILDMRNTLAEHAIGDRQKITYWRTGETHQVKAELTSPRQFDLPATVEELLEAVSSQYAVIQEGLAAAFQNTTEEQAALAISTDQWSASDVLAHLILTERELHSWIMGMIEGQEPGTFISRQATRQQAIRTAFSNSQALLAELTQNQIETITMINNLPLDFLARKSSYWRLVMMLYSLLEQSQANLHQIRQTLAVARDFLAAQKLEGVETGSTAQADQTNTEPPSIDSELPFVSAQPASSQFQTSQPAANGQSNDSQTDFPTGDTLSQTGDESEWMIESETSVQNGDTEP